MTPKEIIESTTLTEDEKVTEIQNLMRKEALDFAFYLHPAGVYRESFYMKFQIEVRKTEPLP